MAQSFNIMKIDKRIIAWCTVFIGIYLFIVNFFLIFSTRYALHDIIGISEIEYSKLFPYILIFYNVIFLLLAIWIHERKFYILFLLLLFFGLINYIVFDFAVSATSRMVG